MICVACNIQESFDNIDKWKVEINEIESEKPILLIQTKSDLEELVEDPVTIA